MGHTYITMLYHVIYSTSQRRPLLRTVNLEP